MMKKSSIGAVMALAGFWGMTVAEAGSLAAPVDKPILTVSGKITETNKDNTAQFDRAMLESLGTVTVETTTPWYNGSVKFEGVSLDKLMHLVGARGSKVRAVALNDYAATVPMEDIAKYKVILALKRDGQYMSVRDKGPLFIIYPYDSQPELRSQVFYARSVWQVKRLEIQD
jgi:hypothetical protein